MYNFRALFIPLCLIPSLSWSEWTIVTPVTSHNLNGIAWIDSNYIVVGDSGTILISSDGINWSKENSGTSTNLFVVDGKDSLRIAAGDSGIAIASKNHGLWDTQKIGDSLGFQTLSLSSNTIFLGARNSSKYWYGHWGGSWTSSSTTTPLAGIQWDGLQFIGVGGNAIITSPDGIVWSGSTLGINALTALAMDNENLFATNRNGGVYWIYWNTTLFRWESSIFSGISANPHLRRLFGIAARNGHRIAVGDSGTAISWEGLTNPVSESVGTIKNLCGVAIGDSSAVIVGDNGLILVQRQLTHIAATGSSKQLKDKPVSAGLAIVLNRFSRIPLPHVGAWEISVYSVNGQILMRKMVHSDYRFVDICNFMGDKNNSGTNVLFYSLRIISGIQKSMK